MMKKNKTRWNTVAGVLNIINAVFMLVYIPVALGVAVSDGFSGTSFTNGTVDFFQIFNLIVLAVNIVALVVSHKHGISIIGHILGIIGNALFAITGILFWANLILSILGAVFVLMQHPSNSTDKNNPLPPAEA